MVEETESPRIFHIWSALAGIAACLGRRTYLQDGDEQIFPNIFVALVGPPGVRKSSAMNMARKRVAAATEVRFAPDDTGGQRQGLIVAMQGKNLADEEDKMKEQVDAVLKAGEISAERLLSTKPVYGPDPRDIHCIFVTASEFNSFLGRNALDMLTFLIKMWDGENYDYTLKKEQLTLDQPLMTLIGCTTPTNIATALPPEAIGQGFMSRMILVHSNQKYKSLPRRPPLDNRLVNMIEQRYADISYNFDGQMIESTAAAKLRDELYEEPVKIEDARFLYYCERRPTHLVKLSMLLAASRNSHIIDESDVREAHAILRATEAAMPQALGEYGLTKISAARQKMLEFLQHVKIPVLQPVLYAMMGRDMTLQDFNQAIADFQHAGKIMPLKTSDGLAYTYIEKFEKLTDQILLSALQEKHGVNEEKEDNVVPLKKLN